MFCVGTHAWEMNCPLLQDVSQGRQGPSPVDALVNVTPETQDETASAEWGKMARVIAAIVARNVNEETGEKEDEGENEDEADEDDDDDDDNVA